MPYFINIGRFKGLKGVMGARGWHIWRRKNTVHVRWGAIEVRNRYPKQFIWVRGSLTKKWRSKTVEAAKKAMQQRINEKKSERRANGDKAYQKLPSGQMIRMSPETG
jgi:hypothetical protein